MASVLTSAFLQQVWVFLVVFSAWVCIGLLGAADSQSTVATSDSSTVDQIILSTVQALSSLIPQSKIIIALLLGLLTILVTDNVITNTLKLIWFKVFFVDAKPGNSFAWTLMRNFAPFFTFERNGTKITVITRATEMREILQEFDVFGQGEREAA